MVDRSNEQTFMTFRTNGDWSAKDVMTLVSSISTIYDIFLTFQVQQKYESRYLETLERNLKYQRHLIDHPFYRDLLMTLREMIQDWRKGRLPYPPTQIIPFLAPLNLQSSKVDYQQSTPTEIYKYISLYVSESDRLQVRKIHIASPGGFSFKGIGEIVKEIRELIKDLWYRNNQERKKGQLEIIEQYLCIRRDHPDIELPPSSITGKDRKLVRKVSEQVEKLKELENKDKLVSLPEYIDSLKI